MRVIKMNVVVITSMGEEEENDDKECNNDRSEFRSISLCDYNVLYVLVCIIQVISCIGWISSPSCDAMKGEVVSALSNDLFVFYPAG